VTTIVPTTIPVSTNIESPPALVVVAVASVIVVDDVAVVVENSVRPCA